MASISKTNSNQIIEENVSPFASPAKSKKRDTSLPKDDYKRMRREQRRNQ